MYNLRPEDIIVIDIETASAQSHFEHLTPEWQKLWDEKTCRTRDESVSAADFYPQRAGVMAEFSRIVCISIGYFSEEPHLAVRIKSFFDDDEKQLLENFLAVIKKIDSINKHWSFAGHNIKEFDIPFICRRLLINGLRIPPCLDFQNMKPWETNIVDTFQYWRFGDYKNYTSLKLLAAAMGLPSPKDDIDGSMVGELFWESNPEQRQKNISRIAAYCAKDVVTTANVILKFKGLQPLNANDVEIVS